MMMPRSIPAPRCPECGTPLNDRGRRCPNPDCSVYRVHFDTRGHPRIITYCSIPTNMEAST